MAASEQKKAILPYLQVCCQTATSLLVLALLFSCVMKLLQQPGLKIVDGCVVQRADEVGKMEPKVAYYCRMYAVDQARSCTTVCG